MTTLKSMRALSIRQPFAEQILRGTKEIEYRSRPTKIRERIYIYASMRGSNDEDFVAMGALVGDFPTGVLVGTIEIVDCTEKAGVYHWHLAKPERLLKPIKPKTHQQPVFFYPFIKKE